MSSANSRLQIASLAKRFGGLRVFDGVSFSAAEGEITALIGPNGAGKTTLINIIAGVFPPDGGQILIDGNPAAMKRPHEALDLGIARTFQDVRLFPTLTV